MGAAALLKPTAAQERAAELCFLSALEQSRLLRTKKLSARELLDAHLEQIARWNPKVNAIVTLVVDQAREQARRADESLAAGKWLGALHGLPIAHKDLNDTRGIRTTYGSRIFKDNVPTADALIIGRIRNAGAITIGKTNTPEFGAGSQTFNEVFGATHNPYDLSKTCGGSSGGAAVALACGMIPLAEGSDMGGSLRNPAAFCNVVGLRTAPGRVPHHAASMAWSTLSVDGPMARSVADLAFFLSAIAGPDARSPIAIAEPGAKFAASLERNFKGIRVAWAKNLGGVPFDPRVRHVVDAQRKTFESLGCAVEETEPDFSGADEAFKTLRGWLYAAGYQDLVKTHRDLVKDTIIWEVERGVRITGLELSRAESLHTALFDRMRLFFEKYDYFILPTTQVPPFDIAEPYVKEINGVKMETYIDWMKSCYFISITGLPAISAPCGFTPEGLPVGLQIVGRHQDEWSVLQLAHAYEQATGFGNKHPQSGGLAV
jgi:amidase